MRLSVPDNQWSNYSIIYEGAGKYGELFEAPSRPPRSHISGSKKPVRLLMSNDSAGVEVGQ